jgi:hypothetical protein
MAVFSPRSHPIRNIREIRGPSSEISAPLTTEAMMSIRPESLGDAKKCSAGLPHPTPLVSSAAQENPTICFPSKMLRRAIASGAWAGAILIFEGGESTVLPAD